MTPLAQRSRRPTFAAAWATTLAAVLVAACSSGGPSATTATATPAPAVSGAPTTSPVATPAGSAAASSSPASTGPAVAQLQIAGDASIAGALASPSVNCRFPSLDGQTINISGTGTDKDVYVAITVASSAVYVSLRAGQGATFTSRDFKGTGVSGFDPAHGAQLDGPMTETTAAGAKTGTLGAVTSLKGSVDCGGQQPGTSTIQLSGTLPGGAVASTLDQVRVICNTGAAPQSISVYGIGMVGTTRSLIVMSISTDKLTIFFATSPTMFLTATGTGTGVIASPTAGTADGDATGTDQSGAALKVHAAGAVTCGT